MENHITITELSNDRKKLTPDKGYMLKFKDAYTLYSEVVVKEPDGWVAVKV